MLLAAIGKKDRKTSIDKYERAKSRCMVLRREILRNEKIISKQERRILGLETTVKAKDECIAKLKKKVNSLLDIVGKRKCSNDCIRESLEKLREDLI